MNNTQEKRNDNDTKKIVTMLVLVFTLMFCTTGATYAFLAFTASNNSATGTVAAGGLTLTVTASDLKSGNTGVMVPQVESVLGTAMNSSNKCVDTNGNIICKVYTISVTNGSTAKAKVMGYIQFSDIFSGTNDVNKLMPNLKMKRISSTTSVGSYSTSEVGKGTSSSLWDIITSGSTCTVGSASVDGTCTSVDIAAGATLSYTIIVWINETGSEQNDSGTWRGTITFQGANGTGITSTIK